MLHLIPFSGSTYKKGSDEELVVLLLDELYAEAVHHLDEAKPLDVRIYALYTLYTLYSTQTSLKRRRKRRIRLPEALWKCLLKLKNDIASECVDPDPAAILSRMLECNMFLFSAAPRFPEFPLQTLVASFFEPDIFICPLSLLAPKTSSFCMIKLLVKLPQFDPCIFHFYQHKSLLVFHFPLKK